MSKIRTIDGRLVDPFNVTAADVHPSVHIHSICLINRFTGHTKHPYSVGQHTRNLVILVPKHLKRVAMIHDWQESWFNDLASPVKREFPEYVEAEERAKEVIGKFFGVDKDDYAEFDWWDKNIYVDERDALQVRDPEHPSGLGDDRPGIGCGKFMFEETDWKLIRSQLSSMADQLWPDMEILSI